jgi:hypothetical protein
MHQYKGVYASASDHRGSGDGLAERGWGAQHAHVVMEHRGSSRLLISSKRPNETGIDRLASVAFVPQITAD